MNNLLKIGLVLFAVWVIAVIVFAISVANVLPSLGGWLIEFKKA